MTQETEIQNQTEKLEKETKQLEEEIASGAINSDSEEKQTDNKEKQKKLEEEIKTIKAQPGEHPVLEWLMGILAALKMINGSGVGNFSGTQENGELNNNYVTGGVSEEINGSPNGYNYSSVELPKLSNEQLNNTAFAENISYRMISPDGKEGRSLEQIDPSEYKLIPPLSVLEQRSPRSADLYKKILADHDNYIMKQTIQGKWHYFSVNATYPDTPSRNQYKNEILKPAMKQLRQFISQDIPKQELIAILQEESKRILSYCNELANHFKIPLPVLMAEAWFESGFQVAFNSKSAATGWGQYLNTTWGGKNKNHQGGEIGEITEMINSGKVPQQISQFIKLPLKYSDRFNPYANMFATAKDIDKAYNQFDLDRSRTDEEYLRYAIGCIYTRHHDGPGDAPKHIAFLKKRGFEFDPNGKKLLQYAISHKSTFLQECKAELGSSHYNRVQEAFDKYGYTIDAIKKGFVFLEYGQWIASDAMKMASQMGPNNSIS